VKLPNEFNAFRLSPINIGGKYWQLSARRLLPTFHSWFPLAMGNRIPLFERAWAYQERLVSPRVVYFTQHEVLWECFECIGCECIGDASTASQFPPAYADGCPKIRHIKLLDQGQVAERWHPIVEEYSRLDLTIETDKFLSISAVAKQIQQLRQSDRYWPDYGRIR
jgi:hypothetical protein